MEHQATRGRMLPDAELRRFDAVVPAPFGAVGIRTEGLGTEDECIAEILYLPPGVPEVAPKNRLAGEAYAQIRRYLDDPSQAFALPLKPLGTRYQRRVWDKIAEIPSGRVRSYGEVARELHSGPRAVGQACGANYFPLAIPCHRVVASGGIGGFGGMKGVPHIGFGGMKGVLDIGFGGMKGVPHIGSARNDDGFHIAIKRWLLAHEGIELPA